MSSKNQIKGAIEAALVAGKGDIAFVCYSEESSSKGVRKKKKRLNASENWRVYKNTIWGRDGTFFNGIASWKKNVTVFVNGCEHRFRILQIDRLGWRTYYAISIGAAAPFPTCRASS